MKLNLLVFAAAALLAVSCSDKQASKTDGLPIVVYPTVSTRASDTNFEAGDRIGLIITLDDMTTHADNAALTHNGQYFEDDDLKWYSTNKSGDFTAYYPYQENYTGSYSVLADQTSDGYYQSDLLLAVARNVQPHPTGVSLGFIHAMSQIVVYINNNSVYEMVEVCVEDTKNDVLIDYTGDRPGVMLKLTAVQISILAQSLGADTYRAVVAPQTAEAVITVRNETGQEVSTTLPSTLFTAGTSYSVSVTLSDNFDITEVKIQSNGEIEAWVPGDIEDL